MSWRFSQGGGVLIGDDETVIPAYAGKNIPGGIQGRGNPDAQNVRGIGPLPRGWYTIGAPSEEHPHLGPYALPLTPDPENEMFGRGAFFIHGDNPEHDASEGCIVPSGGHASRALIWESGDHRLEVTC